MPLASPALALLIAGLRLLPGDAKAQDSPPEAQRNEVFGCPGGEWPWKGQGPVVNIPAALAASPAGLVGTALAIAFVPADLIDSARGRSQDEPIPRFARAGVCSGVYLGKGLAL